MHIDWLGSRNQFPIIHLEQVQCLIGGQERPCTLDDRYLHVGTVMAGDSITVEFPLKRETVRTTIEVRLTGIGTPIPDNRRDKTYTLDVKGFSVVNIWPRDLHNTSDEEVTNWIFGRSDAVRPEQWIVHPFFTDAAVRSDVPRFTEVRRYAAEYEMDW